MEAYTLVLNEAPAKTLALASRADQRQLATILDQLKLTPFKSGDYRQRDETGRFNEVTLFDDWLVTHWSDHAVREIRIVSLERVRG